MSKAWWTLAAILLLAQTTATVAAPTPDQRLFDAIHTEMRNPAFDEVVPFLNRFGDSNYVATGWVLAAAVGALLDRADLRDTGVLGGAGFAASAGTVWAMKRLTDRRRPLNSDDKRSMPSGHAAVAFSAATVLAHRYPRWRVPLYLTAAGVAFGRVYLGRHYPSDVLVGAGIGYGMTRLVLSQEATLLSVRF